MDNSFWNKLRNIQATGNPLPDPGKNLPKASDILTGREVFNDAKMGGVTQQAINNGTITLNDIGQLYDEMYDVSGYPVDNTLDNLDPDYRKRLELYLQHGPRELNARLSQIENVPEPWQNRAIEGFSIAETRRSPERQAVLYARWRAGKGGRASKPGHGMHETGNAADLRIQYRKDDGTIGTQELEPWMYPALEETLSLFGLETPLHSPEDSRHAQKKLNVPLDVVLDRYDRVPTFNSLKEAMDYGATMPGKKLSYRTSAPYTVQDLELTTDERIQKIVDEYNRREAALLGHGILNILGPPEFSLRKPTVEEQPKEKYTLSRSTGEKIGTFSNIDEAQKYALQLGGDKRQFGISKESDIQIPTMPYDPGVFTQIMETVPVAPVEQGDFLHSLKRRELESLRKK